MWFLQILGFVCACQKLSNVVLYSWPLIHDLVMLGTRKVGEDVVGDHILIGRSIDTYSEAIEVSTAQTSNDVSEAVVACVPSPAFVLDGGIGEVYLIVDDKDILGIYLVELRYGADWSSGFVHIRLWLDEHDGSIVDITLGDETSILWRQSKFAQPLLCSELFE
jgi:hypothetical protein